jgi:predicted CopG family antitoxin
MGDKTTIEVTDDTWSRLDELKDRGESFDDVISTLLPEQEAGA